MMDDSLPPFDENELSDEDLAILQAFTEKQNWQAQSTKPGAVAPTDEASDDLLLFFAAEVAEDVEAMRQALNQLETEDRIGPTLFLPLKRLGHKIHGTAGAVECHAMATVAHFIEIIAGQLGDGLIFPVVGVGALAKSITVLEAALQHIVSHNSEGDVPLDWLLNEFRGLNIDLEQLLADEEADIPPTPVRVRETPVAYQPGEEDTGVKLVRVDMSRIERLLHYSDYVAELRVPLEGAQEQVEAAMRELRATQAYLRQLLPTLPTLLEEKVAPPQIPSDHTFSSLVARILNQPVQGEARNEAPHRANKGRPRTGLIKTPGAPEWDELDMERYGEKDLLIRSLGEAITNVLLASSRVDTTLTTLNQRQQEYRMQVTNMRSAALVLRLAPLKLLLPRLRRVIEESSLGSRVQFDVQGEETEADQEIIEALAAPLDELVRNCLTGIGQNTDQCRIWLNVAGVGNEITLEIGFSMPVSGGALQAIREPMQRLQGTYTLQRNETGGMSFCLRFPRSQGAAQCLLVRAGSQYLLVSFSQVIRIENSRNKASCQNYHLCDLLGFPPEQPGPQSGERPMLILPQLTTTQNETGVIVDEVISEVEYIVRPLVPYLQRPGIAGAAADGRGRVLLMLDLPELVRNQSATRSTVHSRYTPEQASRKLGALVADDSVVLRLALVQLLQQMEFNVDEARDGLEALEKMLNSPPDIFLLDVEMPNLNGYDLLSMISQYPELAKVKIIMLSSRSSEKHIQQALKLGAHDYLTKPCTQEQLSRAIAGLIKH